ncbi:MFS transporter [Anaerocolumna jejuensis]|uniref:MFS transporter n=1 Tax=Anaerocolumna jejuensis TaxID=259063 RepID=UPI003F7C0DC9
MKNSQPIWTKGFILITVVNLLIFCGFQMLLPTLPIYMKSLSGTNAAIGWIAGLSTIASLIVRPFSGTALDKLGRKGVLLSGILIIMLATLAYMCFPIVGVILAVRLLHGVGWGMASTASNTVATDVIPKARFGEGMGFFSLSTSLAMALAPGIGLFILARSHIQGLVLVSIGFAAIGLIISFFIQYKKVEGKEVSGKVNPYERTAVKPSIVMFFICVTYGSITGFITLFAMECGIENIGIFFMVFAAAMVISRPIFGKLVDKLGFNIAVYPGLIALAVSMVILQDSSSLLLFLIVAFLYGVGFGALQSSLQTLSVIKAPKERLGAANATFFTGFDGGIGFGSILAGIVSASMGYSRMYLLFTIFLIVSAVLYFFLIGKNAKNIKAA